MSVRVEVTSWPRQLSDLEELCRVARQQGFASEAAVSLNASYNTVTVRAQADELDSPIVEATQ